MAKNRMSRQELVSLRRQETDLASLRTEREANTFPLSKAPFLRADTFKLTVVEEVSSMYFALSQSNRVPFSQ